MFSHTKFSLGPKICWGLKRIFRTQKIFETKHFFGHKSFLDPNIYFNIFQTQKKFLTQKCFWPKKFFTAKNFFGRNIFLPENFGTHDPKIFLDPKFFWPHNFVRIKKSLLTPFSGPNFFDPNFFFQHFFGTSKIYDRYGTKNNLQYKNFDPKRSIQFWPEKNLAPQNFVQPQEISLAQLSFNLVRHIDKSWHKSISTLFI